QCGQAAEGRGPPPGSGRYTEDRVRVVVSHPPTRQASRQIRCLQDSGAWLCAVLTSDYGLALAHTPPVDENQAVDIRRTVVIADDDLLLREGLSRLVAEAGYSVLGQAGDAGELFALVREHRPDVAIVDIRMPPDHSTEGLRAAEVIRREMPDT